MQDQSFKKKELFLVDEPGFWMGKWWFNEGQNSSCSTKLGVESSEICWFEPVANLDPLDVRTKPWYIGVKASSEQKMDFVQVPIFWMLQKKYYSRWSSSKSVKSKGSSPMKWQKDIYIYIRMALYGTVPQFQVYDQMYHWLKWKPKANNDDDVVYIL